MLKCLQFKALQYLNNKILRLSEEFWSKGPRVKETCDSDTERLNRLFKNNPDMTIITLKLQLAFDYA